MKLQYIAAFIAALIIAPFMAFARAFAPQGVDALNTQGTHGGTITRTAEGALAAHLLVAEGTTAGAQVKVCTATLIPLGTVYDDAETGKPVTVELITGCPTRLVIASKAIAAGVRVYATAAGKVTDAVVSNAYLVGQSLTAAAGDGSELEIMSLSPVKNP